VLEAVVNSGSDLVRRGRAEWLRRARRVVAAAVAAVVVASLLTVTPASGQPAPGSGHLSAHVRVNTAGKPASGQAWPVKRAASAVRAAPVWPKPGRGRVTVPPAGERGAGGSAPVPVGALPVRLAPASGSAATRAADVTVELLDRAAVPKQWRDGLLLRVSGAQETAASSAVKVVVDYRGFRHAFGGDWASRLRLYQLPDCATRTPDRPQCQATPLRSANQPGAATVAADVPVSVSSVGTLVALAAESSGPEGDFSATPLAASATWTAGGSTGDFNWSYEMRTPPATAGVNPSVALTYSSSNVDGRSDAANNQPSWVGEGFEYAPGYIERGYVPCRDDMSAGHNNSQKTGDNCWRSNNAVLALNGRAVDLVYEDGKGWHARSEDAAKIEKLSGTSNADDNGEYWKVTTGDGVQYFFGRNSLPGHTSTTNSAWTVPVAGNHDGDPCYDSTFISSFCDQAWRWNLDYVIDPHGNTTTYWYNAEENRYGRNLTATDKAKYVRGGYLKRIDYGTWDRGAADRSVTATAQVVFTPGDRCEYDCSLHDGNHWKDVPWDQECTADAASCGTNYWPTFWTTQRLAKVTTRVWDTTKATPGWQDVDSWTLDHTYPSVGDGQAFAGLWLNSIVHTGHVTNSTATGPTVLEPISLPPVTFEPTTLRNRVLTAHNTTNNRHRIGNIVTETGAKIQVTYSQPDCTAQSLPSAPHTNTRRCYPVLTQDPANPDGPDITEWWHKYVVEQVSASDLKVIVDGTDRSAPVQNTFYKYLGSPVWHYADDDGLVKPKRKTWNQFRGYTTVEVRTGDAPAQTLTRSTYLRGMHGDRLTPTGGTRDVTVGASLGSETVKDEDQFAGMVREQAVYDGDISKPVSKTVNVPWMSPATASRTINGDTVTARFTNTKATYTAIALGVDGQGGWRTSRTQSTFNDTYGTPDWTQDDGDLAKNDDQRCATYSYNRNTSKNLVLTLKQTTTTALACGTAPASTDDVISHVRNYYDGATSPETAPTLGAVTKVEQLKDWTADRGPVWQTASQATYDPFGRPLTTTDVRGNVTTTAYTPSASGPVTKVDTTTPDPSGGTAWKTTTDMTPYWATPAKTTDPNGRVSEAQYDPLGRVAKVWKVGWTKADHPTSPSAEYSYVLSPTRVAYPYTMSKTLHAGGGYHTTYQIQDAFFRPRQVQTAAVGGDRIVTDTIHDKAGRVEATYPVHREPGTPSGALWWAPEWSVPAVNKTVYDNASRPKADIFLGTDGVTNLVEKWRTTTEYAGDRTLVTPPDGGTPTTTVNDVRGNTVELRQHATDQGVAGPYQATRYTFDRRGELVKVTDPDGNEWAYTFDVKGRQIQAKDPDKGVTTSEYNDVDDLVKTTDANNKTLAYRYDSLGRKTGLFDNQVSDATKRAEWIYDKLYTGQTVRGQLTQTKRYEPAGSATTYTWRVSGFSARYQPTGITYLIPTAEGTGLAGTMNFSYGYSPYDGSPTTVGLPAMGGLAAETVTTEYDATTGLPTALKTNAINVGSYVTGQQYTAYGEPTITTRKITGGSYVEDANYYEEATRRLTRTTIKPQTAAGIVSDRNYSYDPAGNITGINDTPAVGTADNQCFRYDPLRRLTNAWTPKGGVDCGPDPAVANLGGPAPYWLEWTFDRVGNRLTETSHATAGDTTRNYTVPAGGQNVVRPHAVTSVTTQAPGAAPVTTNYGYDNAGNTTCRPASNAANTCPPGTASQNLTWDPEGHLTNISGDAPSAGSNLYDADGNRLLRRDATGTTLYLPGQELRREGATTTATRYYTFAGKLIASRTPTDLTWLYTDHQQTQHTSVDDSSKAVTTRRQTPYGQPRGTFTPWVTPKGYVGGDTDPTGLTHLGAREYDPNLGRFISVDPIMDLASPQQWHGYSYANNTPITLSDPSGLDPGGGQCYDDLDKKCSPTWGEQPAPTKSKPAPPPGSTTTGDRNVNKDRANAKAAFLGTFTDDYYACRGTGHCDNLRKEVAAGRLDPYKATIHALCAEDPSCIQSFYSNGGNIETALTILGFLPGIGEAADVTAGLIAAARGDWKGALLSFGATIPIFGALAGAKRLDGLLAGAARGCSSFSADTHVLMADGTTKPIQDLEPGDVVLATDPETGEQGPREVTHVWVHQDQLLDLELANGDTITTTEDHPFWNHTDQQWQQAQQLDPGDLLHTSTGASTAVSGINWNSSRRGAAYNLTINDIHTYYVLVGSTSVLVHNAPPSGCLLTGSPNVPVINSKTVFTAKDRSFRVDIENPNPGQAGAQIHLQPMGRGASGKYYYHPESGTWIAEDGTVLSSKIANQVPQSAIDKAYQFLGVTPP
jgi:RHS repeat-associated protein